jgi:hypothetical protein
MVFPMDLVMPMHGTHGRNPETPNGEERRVFVAHDCPGEPGVDVLAEAKSAAEGRSIWFRG